MEMNWPLASVILGVIAIIATAVVQICGKGVCPAHVSLIETIQAIKREMSGLRECITDLPLRIIEVLKKNGH